MNVLILTNIDSVYFKHTVLGTQAGPQPANAGRVLGYSSTALLVYI